jgi:two-component system sensor histidine kinase DesK
MHAQLEPDRSRLARLWPLLWLIWLPYLGVPLAALVHARPAPLYLAAALAGVALFVATYLWAAWRNDLSHSAYPAPPGVGRWRWGPVAVLTGLSVALILGDGSRWLGLLIFTGASVGGRFALGQALRLLAALVVLTALLGALTHDPRSDIEVVAFWTGMAGVLVIIVNHLRLTNRALHDAREENARLAVEAERLRIARDLHDLLGHSLAHIALKSEMAEAFVPTAPDQAVEAMGEVGEAARTALREVRAAVAGYHLPTLASELRGAGEILAAAGVTYRWEGQGIAVPPAAEAVLAWALREGVTNVIRHSRARHCVVRIFQQEGMVGIEVIDDGRGGAQDAPLPAAAREGGGNGLPGLRARVAALGGSCAASPMPEGGFRLSVLVPATTAVRGGGARLPARATTGLERGG